MRVFRHPVIRAALLLGVGLSCALDASPARAQADESAITPPSLVTRQDPTYPPAALTEKREGEVALEITIDETGKVTDINTRPKSLIRETRKVRTNIPLTGAALRQ